jgi:hypothetical protein
MKAKSITRAVNVASTGGLVATAALTTFKLFNLITWSWWCVALPAVIPAGAVIGATVWVALTIKYFNED